MINVCSFISKNIVNEFLALKKLSDYESFMAIGFLALTFNANNYILKGRLSVFDIEDLCDDVMEHYCDRSPYGRAILNDLVYNQLVLYNQIDGNMSYSDAQEYVDSQILTINNAVESTFLKANPGFLTTKAVRNFLSLKSCIFDIADRFERQFPHPNGFYSN